MKATRTYDEKVLQNDDNFSNPFYKRFKLEPYTLKLDSKISKTYRFPALYGDVTCAIGIFLCSMRGAKKFMPHAKMLPVKMTGGKSLVVFSCYGYKSVLGMAPYNEIAMTIPVMVNPSFNVPMLPMLMDKAFKKFGYYVFSMPVTSLENQLRGLRIWGLPKIVQDIDMYEEGGFNICKAYEESGAWLRELEIEENPFQFRFAKGMTACFDLPNELYKAPFSFK